MTAVAVWNPTIGQQIAELQRELVMRRQVFPKLIASHKLQQRDADFRLACLQATLELLTNLQASERHHGP